MNSLHFPLSQEILMLAALFGGKIILLTLQANKLTLSHPQQDIYAQIIDKPPHVGNNSLSCIDLFVQTKI